MSEPLHTCWYTQAQKDITLRSVFYNDIALCCVNILIVALNLLANGLVMYRYHQTRFRQPVSNMLLFLLASFDLLKGAVAQPFFIATVILDLVGIYYCVLQTIRETIVCIFVGFAFIMVTTVLTSERFFGILYPIRHRIYMRKNVLFCLSISLFIAWTICAIMFHIIWPRFVEINYTYLCILTIGLIYTLFVYVKIFCVSRKTRIEHSGSNSGIKNTIEDDGDGTVPREISLSPCQKMRNSTINAVQSLKITAKEKKTIFRMLCIIGVVYLTSLPVLATFAYIIVNGSDKFFLVYLYPWATTISFFSGAVNPYIYCYRNEYFRRRKPALKNSPSCSYAEGNVGFSATSRSR